MTLTPGRLTDKKLLTHPLKSGRQRSVGKSLEVVGFDPLGDRTSAEVDRLEAEVAALPAAAKFVPE
jgi:hypothetical protein